MGKNDPVAQAFLDFQGKLQELFPALTREQSEALETTLGQTFQAATHIQAAQLDPEARSKRTQTGGEAHLSGPHYFRADAGASCEGRPGAGKGAAVHGTSPRARPGDDDDEDARDSDDDLRSEPHSAGDDHAHGNEMGDVRYPPETVGDDDGIEGPEELFIEWDPEMYWQRKKEEAISAGSEDARGSAHARQPVAEPDADGQGIDSLDERASVRKVAQNIMVFREDYDVASHPYAKSKPGPSKGAKRGQGTSVLAPISCRGSLLPPRAKL